MTARRALGPVPPPAPTLADARERLLTVERAAMNRIQSNQDEQRDLWGLVSEAREALAAVARAEQLMATDEGERADWADWAEWEQGG